MSTIAINIFFEYSIISPSSFLASTCRCNDCITQHPRGSTFYCDTAYPSGSRARGGRARSPRPARHFVSGLLVRSLCLFSWIFFPAPESGVSLFQARDKKSLVLLSCALGVGVAVFASRSLFGSFWDVGGLYLGKGSRIATDLE